MTDVEDQQPDRSRGFRVRAPGDVAKRIETGPDAEKVLLVGVQFSGTTADEAERSLDELAALVASAGGEGAECVLQRRDHPDPATFIGKGKAAEVGERAQRLRADTVVFDDELSPAQLRNLDELLPTKVIDRTILILDIFAQRARSLEGRKQVELAQLTYGLPRLRGWGIALSRIGGLGGGGGGGGRAAVRGGAGGGTMGGGRGPIGTRGPGETQLEVDRRKIQRRITKLRRELKVLGERRARARFRRRESVATVSLAGYTNGGKSTLLNRLTHAGVVVENRLFSTLDPTTRRLELPDGRPIVMTDTVGFIRKLPHGLVEAFKSTLEEVSEADVIVHVVDASGAEPEGDVSAVDEVLAEIGVTEVPRVLALNKADLLAPADRVRLAARFPDAVAVSAQDGTGVTELLDIVGRKLSERVLEVEALLPYSQGALLARLHDAGRVLHAEHEASGVRVLVRARTSDLAALGRYVVRGSA